MKTTKQLFFLLALGLLLGFMFNPTKSLATEYKLVYLDSLGIDLGGVLEEDTIYYSDTIRNYYGLPILFIGMANSDSTFWRMQTEYNSEFSFADTLLYQDSTGIVECTTFMPNGRVIVTSFELIGNIYDYLEAKICLISIDNQTKKNIIYWERPLETAGVDSVFIYRETNISYDFQKIGSIPVSSRNAYVDGLSNPAIQSNRYYISFFKKWI